MERKNTSLDDISAVIGFTATIQLAAWFGDRGNLYIPIEAKEGQLLVKLLGLDAAKRLTENFGQEHINIPRIVQYENTLVKRRVAEFVEHDMITKAIALNVGVSERRVQQICRELEALGLIPIIAPKTAQKNAPENTGQKSPTKMPQKTAPKKKGSGSGIDSIRDLGWRRK